MTPTQRTLARLRNDGYLAAVVEKWIPAKAGGFRQDMFGLVDVVGLPIHNRGGQNVLFVQSCGDSWAAHKAKMLEKAEVIKVILNCNISLELWSWVKRKPRGERATWAVRRGWFGVCDGCVVMVDEVPEVEA